uniref:Fibronectin type-III domain-containing protein n=2 Tax=Esox lucius TaxID=8010 RepID=A0A3P8XZQ8_ESOLU
MGNQCASAPSSSVNINTAPCAPTMVTSQYNCSSNVAVLNWADSVGRVSFMARLDGTDHQDNCTSTGTSCSFTDLYCGHSYNFTVQALGTDCNSSLSTLAEIDTVPCAPQNVSAGLLCANHSALITWVRNPRSVSYNVIVLGEDGDSKNCHTNDTSCQVPDLHCGTIYNITVTPFSRTCSGVASTAYTFNAGSCAPTDVIVSPQCNSNMSTVSWTAVAGADMYVATATDNNGHSDTCSTNSTGCSFTALRCAQTYNVTVVTVYRGCASDPSPNVELRTALCPPSNLKGSVSCQTNILSLIWDASPVYSANYTLHSQKIGATNTTISYPTSDTFLSISGLQCGELYAFQVVASDNTCNSSLSLPLLIHTVPCQPTNLVVNVECGTNHGIISWDKSLGASYYIAAVMGDDGHEASCTSNDTSCVVTLHCGQMYSSTLVASTDFCNSTLHTDITFFSAPCLPDNVVAELDCQSNVLTVQWQDSPGEDIYTALAIRSDGYQVSCNSSFNSCSITNLPCGQTYDVAVTSSTINCSIIAGSDYKVQSAPCDPQNSTVELECSTNVATVTWDLTSTAQNYTVTATDAFGTNSSCSTSKTSCSFSDLNCGQTYTFSVMGHTNVCMSEVSSPMQMLTAPCMPINVSSSLDCGTGMALITWNSAVGATAYTVQAKGNHGHNSSCSNTGTQCSLSDLACGQEYTVVVVSMHAGCLGQASQAVHFTTAPCSPQPVETQLNCLSGMLNIAWQPRAGATSYHATVQEGRNIMMCDTNTSSCVVPNLSCGNTYNVTVVAQGQSCNSSHSEAKEISTAPCPPTAVSATVNCSTNIAEVTWQSQNVLGVAYSAQAVAAQESAVYCNTADTNCVLIGLKCGSVYNVTVIASKDNCSSLPSLAYTFLTVPCVPLISEVQLLCSSDSAYVTWATAAGADRYEVTAEDNHGGTRQCNATDVTSCLVSALQCGQQYGFSLTASNRLCTSAPSALIQSIAAPCPPQNVNTSVGCENNTTSISWSNSQGALSYTARLHGADGEAACCSSNTSSCDIPLLPCGEIYNVTVIAKGHTCNSSQSSGSPIKTAPCVPSPPVVNLSCSTNIATIAWSRSLGAHLYSVVAHSSVGYSAGCQSAGLSCNLMSLQCGQMYTVSVTAQDSSCSIASQSVLVKTVPCMPTGVAAGFDCQSNAVAVSWLASGGSEYYMAIVTDSTGVSSGCQTAGTQCNVTGVQCGETYHVTVVGADTLCTSPAATDTHTHSAPCVPVDIAVEVDCSNNSAVVSWRSSHGARWYSVSAHSNRGNSTCSSSDLNCTLVNLSCGTAYTVQVVAVDDQCSSNSSLAVPFQSGPCVPQDVVVSLDCSLNTIYLNWNTSEGAESYTLAVYGTDNSSMEIVLSNNVFQLPLLSCGQNYSVTVAAAYQDCSSAPSAPADIQIWPCPSTAISASLDCPSNIAKVAWEESNGTVLYTATLQSPSGQSQTCMSNTGGCSVPRLDCGQNYTVSVTASNLQCNSTPSIGASLQTAPCVPVDIAVEVDCSNNSAVVSWRSSHGARWYSVSAHSNRGNSTCSSSDLNCTLVNLSCGTAYTVQVVAVDDQCASTVSLAVPFQSVPCPAEPAESTLDCFRNVVLMDWAALEGAVSYTVMTSYNGQKHTVCHTNNTNCEVSGMTCGQVYSVSMVSSDGQCDSPPSVSWDISAVPCPPQNILTQLDCSANSANIQWDLALGAESYVVQAIDTNGYMTGCDTWGRNCTIQGLMCSSTYNISVVAINQHCNISKSMVTQLHTEPCVPSAVRGNVNCETGDMTVEWEPSYGARTYTAVAQGNGGYGSSCNTSETVCVFRDLLCGHTYSVSVSAADDTCSGADSSPVTVETVPCEPQNVSARLRCHSNEGVVSWEMSDGVTSHRVFTVGPDGESLTCNSTAASCTLPPPALWPAIQPDCHRPGWLLQ